MNGKSYNFFFSISALLTIQVEAEGTQHIHLLETDGWTCTMNVIQDMDDGMMLKCLLLKKVYYEKKKCKKGKICIK